MDITNDDFDVQLVEAGKGVEVLGPILFVDALGGSLEITSSDYFACLNVTHTDCSVSFISDLSQFSRIEDNSY